MTRLLLVLVFLSPVAMANRVSCELEVILKRVVKKWPLPQKKGMHFVVEMQAERARGKCKKFPTQVVKLDMNLYGDKISYAKPGSRLLMDYSYWDKSTTRSIASGETWKMIDFLD